MQEETNIWNVKKENILTSPKWLRRGTLVIVDAHTEPRRAELDGKFGKREAWIINTEEYGLIYLSPIQFVNVCNALENAKWENITVEL